MGGDVNPNPLWDMVAAINLAEPEFSDEVPLHIEVDTDTLPGESQGQTLAVSGLPPNAMVSLDASFDRLPFDASELFSFSTPSKSVPEPASLLGLLAVGALGIGTLARR